MNEQPEALQIAEWFEGGNGGCELEAAAELRRLHEEVLTLRDSCGAKADRIDRLGETVARLQEEVKTLKLARDAALAEAYMKIKEEQQRCYVTRGEK